MNLHAIRAIYRFELARTARTLVQSIISPVLSTSLYFVVFGAAIGGRITEIEGVSYGAFIVPGLIMLSLLNESISNASFGIYMPKFTGTIYEVLSAPVSPFEMVLWTPFVDCFRTKSMFILPLADSMATTERLAEHRDAGVEGLFRAIEDRLVWLDVPFGSYLLFNPALIHGNRVNRERTTRWSINCRFKGLFTPYADKRLGSFFDVLSMRPATRMALDYKLPEGFDE